MNDNMLIFPERFLVYEKKQTHVLEAYMFIKANKEPGKRISKCENDQTKRFPSRSSFRLPVDAATDRTGQEKGGGCCHPHQWSVVISPLTGQTETGAAHGHAGRVTQ